ncbi:hypothetical protein A7982_12879 [Minicystis rosea]|nr:hypothetical protein A7982_12879 [Minicystis rosea]
MSRARLFALVPALAACAFGIARWSSSPAPAPRIAASATVAVEAPSDRKPSPARPATRQGVRARYRVSSDQRVLVNGKEEARIQLEGSWTTTSADAESAEARFAATKIALRGAQAPSAADMAAPVSLVMKDGVLGAMAFSDETPRAARGLLTGLATTFQHTDRPGASFRVEEEDLLGRYVATYTRSGENRMVRTRSRYTHLRDASGLSTVKALRMVPEERTELRFDEQGLVSAEVHVDNTFSMGESAAVIKTILSAKLHREDIEPVTLPPARTIEGEPISDHLDRTALTRSRDAARVGGAKAPELLAEARRVSHLDRKNPETQKHISVTSRRLSALSRLDDGAAVALADAIRSEPRDAAQVSLLAGSLASAGAPAATNALAKLLDEPLPPEARSAVVVNLGLSRAPTSESVNALSAALDQPGSAEAALALGTQAGKLGEDGGEDAVDLLLQRYEAATSDDERHVYLEALANSGSRKALPVMLAALRGASFELSRVAAYSLRFIPGDDVDDLLLALITSGSTVTIEAVRATAVRSPALWQPRLQAAKQQFQGQKRVVDAIDAVLARWGNLAAAPSP